MSAWPQAATPGQDEDHEPGHHADHHHQADDGGRGDLDGAGGDHDQPDHQRSDADQTDEDDEDEGEATQQPG